MCTSPEFPNFVNSSYGWRAFGGLHLSSKGKLIPQYNLEAAWKRELAPTSAIDQFLLFDTKTESSYRHRFPGHYRHDADPNVVKNRCLISSMRTQEKFQLSVVQEHSDRKIVENYDIKMHGTEESFPNWWLHCDESPASTAKFDEQIIELRASLTEEIGTNFARGRQQFYLVNQENEVHSVFKGSVSSWEQCPLITEEFVIVSNDYMLWSGKIGENLARTKITGGEPLRGITYTDHPRVIVAIEDVFVRTLDLRCDNDYTSNLLFEAPELSEEVCKTNLYVSAEVQTMQTWTHVKSLPDNPYALLALSTHGVYLLDERVPGRALLQNDHCIPHGGQFLSVGGPIFDQIGDGYLQSFYILDQFDCGLWKMEIYKHSNEDWSAIRPLHGVPDPYDKNHIVRRKSQKTVCQKKVSLPVRGISVITCENGWPGRPTEVLFRCFDDGSVMYRMFHYGLNEEEQADVEAASLERNDIYETEKSIRDDLKFANIFGEACMKSKEANCELIDVEVEFPEQRYSINIEDIDPQERELSSMVPLELFQTIHPDAYFSNIVESYWTLDYCSEFGPSASYNFEGLKLD